MLSKICILAMVVIGPLLFIHQKMEAATKYTEYRDLPLSAYGVSDSKITLVIENDILIDSLTHLQMRDTQISAILPYQDSTHAKSLEETLRAQTNISLGHAMPYFYIAVNFALSRIFRNLIFMPHEEDRELAQRFGFSINTQADAFVNIRDLVRVTSIHDKHLRVEVYSSEDSFNRVKSNLRLHNRARAFWDPWKSRIGVFVDPEPLYWLPMQATWGDRSIEETIKHVHDYIMRRTLDTIGHELVHFVQHASGYPIYAKPFLAEAAAVFVEENIAFREEVFQVTSAHTSRGLPLMPPQGSPCRSLIDESPPLLGRTLIMFERVITALNGTNFDLERALLMDEKKFYERELHYDVAYAFITFASTLPRTLFQQYFGPLIEAKIDADKSSFVGLNESFANWMKKEFPQKLGRADNSEARYQQTKRLVSRCLSNQDYISAHAGTRIMAALRPQSLTWQLHAGDVFWRAEVPFFAFDYYAQALAQGKTFGFGDESELRVTSRLGDAFETLGDIKTAVSSFEVLDKVPIDNIEPDPDPLFMILRSKLKKKWLFAKFEARSKSCRSKPLCAFAGCIHFVARTPSVGST